MTVGSIKRAWLAALSAAVLSAGGADACTRFVYKGVDDQIVTARTMDWKVDVGTNLWVFPRGMERDGAAGPNSIGWTSRYGSVIATGYDVSTTDGMNEAGLVANVLWLVESEYPPFDGAASGLAISAWAQYVLDNFATVADAVEALEAEPFTIVTANVPGDDRLATLHLSISDATGDSAIVEHIEGRQVIHHSPDYAVMTNSPIFERQLALDEYWRQIGGAVMLPGTNRAADRFARASFYADAIPRSADPIETIASLFSVIRSVSAPYGISTPDQPNISSTRWRTVADHMRGRDYFELALTPNLFRVDLAEFNLSAETGATLKLDLGPNQRDTFAGRTNAMFVATEPFSLLGL